jgi:hypothetical protein
MKERMKYEVIRRQNLDVILEVVGLGLVKRTYGNISLQEDTNGW